MMHRQWVRILTVAAIVALTALPAFAAQNVGNTSQKGSVVIYPRVDVSGNNTTIIRLSNDNIVGVDMNCSYVNERKGRRDFHFKLTKKQTVWWDVRDHRGSIDVAEFPNDGTFTPGRADVGELICFAVDNAGANQIAFNHLSGTGTVVNSEGTDNPTAFTYASWNFTARNVTEGLPVGIPGSIQLNGVDGGYDACPSYLVAHYSGDGASLRIGVEVDFTIRDNDLALVSCNQDLRQDFSIHRTKVKLNTWNSDEVKFTGAYVCIDSVALIGTDREDDLDGRIFVGRENLTNAVIGTPAGFLRAEGVASSQCPTPNEAAGLVGVLSTSVGGDTELFELGVSMNGAGSTPGFILWDPGSATVPQGH